MKIVLSVQNIRRNVGTYACWTTYPAPHQVGQSHNGSASTTDPLYVWSNTTPQTPQTEDWALDECGNGFTSSTFIQSGRDYVVGTAKSGYTSYTYPHPLIAGIPVAKVIISWAQLQAPAGPRRAVVSWAQLLLPTPAPKAVISWAQLQFPAPGVTTGTGQGADELASFTDAADAAQIFAASAPETVTVTATQDASVVSSNPQIILAGVQEQAPIFDDMSAASVLPSGLALNYPNLPQWDGTKLVVRSGMMERIATNGQVRMRALQSKAKLDPTVVHGFLSQAQRQELIDFYNKFRTVSFTFTAQEDGVPRLCYFAGANPYQIEPIAGMPNTYNATVYLREA